MKYEILDLSDEQVDDIEERLSQYDEKHITYKISGSINIGIVQDGKLVAGASGSMTAFKVFYISTVFVDETERGKGLGKLLMDCIEKRAKSLGANLIRLDTFDWQGADFYKKIGYEQVGQYTNEEDNFSEYFFIKRI